MNKQELLLVVGLSVVLFTPLIFIGWKMHQIDKWFQQVDQRMDKADKRLK